SGIAALPHLTPLAIDAGVFDELRVKYRLGKQAGVDRGDTHHRQAGRRTVGTAAAADNDPPAVYARDPRGHKDRRSHRRTADPRALGIGPGTCREARVGPADDRRAGPAL